MATTKDNDPVNPSSLASLAPAINALCNLFKSSDVPGMIIGGVAASIHGQARATEDVDAAILLDERHLNRFVKLAALEGLHPRISDAIAFAQRNAVLLLEHSESGVSVDIMLGRLPFERYAVEHATSVKIDDVVVPVAAPEDLIVMKAIAHRSQDLQDIRVIVTSNPKLDVKEGLINSPFQSEICSPSDVQRLSDKNPLSREAFYRAPPPASPLQPCGATPAMFPPTNGVAPDTDSLTRR